jgi:transcriptional regulator NrdR family protein
MSQCRYCGSPDALVECTISLRGYETGPLLRERRTLCEPCLERFALTRERFPVVWLEPPLPTF